MMKLSLISVYYLYEITKILINILKYFIKSEIRDGTQNHITHKILFLSLALYEKMNLFEFDITKTSFSLIKYCISIMKLKLDFILQKLL